jgi:hypothetical protein
MHMQKPRMLQKQRVSTAAASALVTLLPVAQRSRREAPPSAARVPRQRPLRPLACTAEPGTSAAPSVSKSEEPESNLYSVPEWPGGIFSVHMEVGARTETPTEALKPS